AFGTLLRSAFQPLERGDHLLGRAVPLLRIRLHRFPDDLPEGMATRPPSWRAVPRDFSEFDDARQEAGAHVTDAVKVKALVDHARLALRGEAPALDAPDGRSFAGTKLDRKSVVEGMMVARGGERVQSISTRSKNRGS